MLIRNVTTATNCTLRYTIVDLDNIELETLYIKENRHVGKNYIIKKNQLNQSIVLTRYHYIEISLKTKLEFHQGIETQVVEGRGVLMLKTGVVS